MRYFQLANQNNARSSVNIGLKVNMQKINNSNTRCVFQAQVNAKSPDGSTALHTAAQKGHLAVIDTLLRCGADINCRNRKGETPLYTAFKGRQHEVRVKVTKSLWLKNRVPLNETPVILICML
jgi:ankyrin repeat protein